MMELYCGRYRRHFWSEFSNRWMYGDIRSIIVIADSIPEAKLKIEKCLSKLEDKCGSTVLSDVIKCVGFNAYEGFEDTFRLEPIIDEIEVVTE